MPDRTQPRLQPLPLGSADFPYAEAYEDNGAPPVFLLHGFLMGRMIWRDNLAGMIDFARPVIFELMVHGRSPVPEHDEAYTIPHYLSCMDRAREFLGYSKVFLCAHSLGSSFALNYALSYPKNVHGVVFTNSTAALRDLTKRPDHFPPDEDSDRLSRIDRDSLRETDAHPTKLRFVSEDLRETLIDEAENLDLVGIRRFVRNAALKANVRDRIGQLNVPALLINGVRESGFQPIRDWAAEHIPNLEITDLDGGHSVNAQVPEDFNARLRAFVEANL